MHANSAMDAFAGELGPTIDDLVDLAHAAGAEIKPRTIRGWVEKGYISKPLQRGRKWRYPNVSIGQVDTLARMRARGVHPDFFRFGLYVEAGSGEPEQVRTFLVEYLGYWDQAVTGIKDKLADPEALREEAAKAARKKGKTAPFPHRVRMRLGERTLAMQFVFASLSSRPLSDEAQAQGQFQLERLVGLRSGRGGTTRNVSDLIALPSDWPPDADALTRAVRAVSVERLEFTRRSIEIGAVWFPAMRSLLASAALGPAASAPLVDVMDEWAEKLTPDVYALLYAMHLAAARKEASDDRIRELLATHSPELMAALLLSECSAQDRELAVRRLRPYPRARLGAFLSARTPSP